MGNDHAFAAAVNATLATCFDPERDTPKVMAGYVAKFHSRLIGLTGTQAEISAAAKAYEVIAEKVHEKTDGSQYLVNHSASTYLIGPDGRGLEIFDNGTSPEEMAARILRLLKDDSS